MLLKLKINNYYIYLGSVASDTVLNSCSGNFLATKKQQVISVSLYGCFPLKNTVGHLQFDFAVQGETHSY